MLGGGEGFCTDTGRGGGFGVAVERLTEGGGFGSEEAEPVFWRGGGRGRLLEALPLTTTSMHGSTPHCVDAARA